MSIKKRSVSIIKFPQYPYGRDEHPIFKVPKNTEYISLHFDKQGLIEEMHIGYEADTGGITMEVDHQWFNSQPPTDK